MRKLINLLFILAVISFNLNSQWFQINIPTTEHLTCLYFNNVNTGYVSGLLEGDILKTTNAGVNWQFYSTGTTDYFYDMHFTGLTTGYVCGTHSRILKTTNSGVNWQIKKSGNSNLVPVLTSLSFPTATVGYAAGQTDSIFKTTDGGDNWISILVPKSNIQQIYFISSLTGWFCAANHFMYKTTDGGVSWINSTLSSFYFLNRFYFINANTGMVVGAVGCIMRTTDGGTNWIQISSNISTPLYDIYFSDQNTGWAVGNNGVILKTTNGGANWFAQYSSVVPWGILLSIHMANSDTGYIAGYGIMLKTTNGGGEPISIQQTGNEMPEKMILLQNYPNPFNPATTIRFDNNIRQNIKISVYDISGRLIENIVNSQFGRGTFSVRFDGTNIPSGVYFYSITGESYSETKKMILIK